MDSFSKKISFTLPLNIALLTLILGCAMPPESVEQKSSNPFITDLNVPIDYANVSAKQIERYAQITLTNVVGAVDKIKQTDTPTFENVIVAMDDINNRLNIANSNCFMLYWVSPDSLSRAKGYLGYQMLDSLSTTLYSDKTLFNQLQKFCSGGIDWRKCGS